MISSSSSCCFKHLLLFFSKSHSSSATGRAVDRWFVLCVSVQFIDSFFVFSLSFFISILLLFDYFCILIFKNAIVFVCSFLKKTGVCVLLSQQWLRSEHNTISNTSFHLLQLIVCALMLFLFLSCIIFSLYTHIYTYVLLPVECAARHKRLASRSDDVARARYRVCARPRAA